MATKKDQDKARKGWKKKQKKLRSMIDFAKDHPVKKRQRARKALLKQMGR